MRTLVFDGDEFPRPNAEEVLRLAIASRRQLQVFGHTGTELVRHFFDRCDWKHAADFPVAPQQSPLPAYYYHSSIIENLSQFAPDLEVPIAETQLLEIANTPDDLEVILEMPNVFLCYHWSSYG